MRCFPLTVFIVLLPSGCSSDPVTDYSHPVTFQMRYQKGLSYVSFVIYRSLQEQLPFPQDPELWNPYLKWCREIDVAISNGIIEIHMRNDTLGKTCVDYVTNLLDRFKESCSGTSTGLYVMYKCSCSVVSNMTGTNCKSKVKCASKKIWTDRFHFNFEVACESSASEQTNVAPEDPKPTALVQTQKGYGQYAPQTGHSKSAYAQQQGQKSIAPNTREESHEGKPQNALSPTNWGYAHKQEYPSGKTENANAEEANPHDSAGKNMQAQMLLHSEKSTPIPTHLVVQTFSSTNTETLRKPSTLAIAPAQSFPPDTEDVEEYPKEKMATSPSVWPSGKCVTCEGHCLSTVTIAIILGPCIVLVLGFGVGIGFLIARIWPDNLKVINLAPPPLPPNRYEVEKSVVSEIIEPPMEAQTVTSQVGSTMQGNTTTATATKFTKHFEICNRPPTTNRSRKVPLQSIVEGITHTCTTIDTAKDKTVLDNP
uniref:Uncharacterized protein n=1 Tax=Ascaris lumbricoides TaxID=6252 RepID=A0A9J2PU07_ASCLU